jgi:hypothetical protein
MITINREYHKKSTIGNAMAEFNGQSFKFHTVELPWKNNERRKSCIPEGTYKCKPHTSPKFGKTFWIQDVPGRSEILIHVGNFTSDLLGCIAPGMAVKDINRDGILDVANSQKALNKLFMLLWVKDQFDVVITSQSGPPVLS